MPFMKELLNQKEIIYEHNALVVPQGDELAVRYESVLIFSALHIIPAVITILLICASMFFLF